MRAFRWSMVTTWSAKWGEKEEAERSGQYSRRQRENIHEIWGLDG